MEKAVRALILSILSALIIYLPADSIAQSPPHKTLKVGFIAPLSGPAAPYGIASRNGFELALDEVESGKFEVIFEDDQYSPAKSVAAFKKLREVDKVDVVVSIGSTPSNAVAPLAERARIPLFAWAGDKRVASGRKYVIRSGQSSSADGEKMAKEALRRNYAQVGFIVAAGDYQNTVRHGFEQEYPKDLLVLVEEVPSDTTDFRGVLLRAKARKANALGLCLHPGQYGIVGKQAHEMGLQTEFFGCDTMQDPNELRISGGTLADSWFVVQNVEEQFRKKYLAKYGNDNVIAGAAVHYEVAKLLSDVATYRGSKSTLEKIRSLGERRGAVGKYSIKTEVDDQYLDIALVVKSMEE